MSIQGGNQTVTVTTGVAGGAIVPAVNASARLRFREEAVTTKITVQTICLGQKFGLSVVALSPDVGVAAPQVTLTNGMLPVNFITNIPAGNRQRRADLQYTASATWAQGNSTEAGDDVHTVTFTLLAQ